MNYINKDSNELMYFVLMDEISIFENENFLVIQKLYETVIFSNNILYEVKNKKTNENINSKPYRKASE